jgi:hypothetical protein
MQTLSDPCTSVSFSTITCPWPWDEQYEVVASAEGVDGIVNHVAAKFRRRGDRLGVPEPWQTNPPRLPRLGFAGFENSAAAAGGRRRGRRWQLWPNKSRLRVRPWMRRGW